MIIDALFSLIAEEMRKQRISEVDLAKKADIPRAVLRKILNNHMSVRFNDLIKVTQALGLNIQISMEEERD